MNIKTEYLEYVGKWIAWDEDSYDPSPIHYDDPDPNTTIVGMGQSEEEAIEDLKEYFDES